MRGLRGRAQCRIPRSNWHCARSWNARKWRLPEMDRDRQLLRHFLAAIAYRTQKAVRGAPQHYPAFSAGNRTRTPAEIVRHMASLMGYVTTHFLGGSYPVKPDPLPTFAAEVAQQLAIAVHFRQAP